MTETDPLGAVRFTRRSAEEVTSDCLEDQRLSQLVDGTLESAERELALNHLAGCARCRAAVASVARAMSDVEVSRAVRGGRSWSRIVRWALPAAAAALLVFMLVPTRPDQIAPVSPHRAPTITAAEAPLPESPVGTVAAASMLRWHTVSGADRYRVTLFDANGRVVFERELTDSVVPLPDSIVLVARKPYLWKVEARVGFDRWAPSSLVEFTVAAPESR